MNNFAIQNLANMEFMLYGTRAGMNMNCPSYYNGYMGAGLNNMGMNFNPMFRGYGNYNKDIFTQANDGTKVNNPYQIAAQGNQKVDWSNPQFRGINDDLNELADYYVKNSAPSESFLGAAVGGAAFGVINNPRMVAHWYNALTSTKAVDKMFKGVKDASSEIGKAWSSKEPVKVIINGKTIETNGYELISNAYSRMHKLESLKKGKLAFFRKSLNNKKNLINGEKAIDIANRITKGMEEAIAKGDLKAIALWTEKAKKLTNAYTGSIPNTLRNWGLQDKLTWLRKKINPSQYEENIAKLAEKSLTEGASKSTLKQALKRSCGIGNGALFAAFEFISDFADGKIQAAFDKDKETGYKQLGQTAVKGAGSAIGWAVGEGIGAWAGAKLGAMAGTAITPGIGTAIGAVAGFIGGSIGCWLMGKVTHKVIGKDAGTVAKAEKMKQTVQGQQELLQLTLPQAMEDKKLNPRTAQAISNVASFYGLS